MEQSKLYNHSVLAFHLGNACTEIQVKKLLRGSFEILVMATNSGSQCPATAQDLKQFSLIKNAY